jgi:hypothetical protein
LKKFLGMSSENIEELGLRGIDEGDKLKSTLY